MTGLELLIAPAITGFSGLIASLVAEKGSAILKRLDWDIGKNLALRKAMGAYVRRYIDRHGTYLMVLGGLGVGKSTFLRKVGLEALRTLGRQNFAGKDSDNLLVPQEIFYQYPCIPVMLELRQFDRADGSIKGAVVRVSPQVWAGIESRMVTVAD